MGLRGHRPTHWGARPKQLEFVFPTKGLYYRQKYSSQPLQTIPQVKKPDVGILSWCGYTWSVVVRLVVCSAKICKTTLMWLMVEKSALNSLDTALVDIPALSMPIARSLKT
jgi:hypothetical protein